MLENSLHASVDVISREIRFMSVNPGFVEFDGSFQVMLFHIPKLISGVDISSKSAEVVYGFDPKKPEESYRAVMDLWALDGDYCIFRWTIPFTFFAEKRWAFFQVRIRTTSGTTVESQWSTKLKKVYVTPGFTGGQEAYTQAQQDAIAALNSRVTALEASGGGSGSIQLQVDQTPTENSQNLVTSGGVWQAVADAAGGGIEFAITQHPIDMTVHSTNSVNFHVTAIGDGLTYQWQYKNTTGTWKNSSSTTGYNTDTLTVAGMSGNTNRDGYEYRCVVTDSSGSVLTSNAAKLTVILPTDDAPTSGSKNYVTSGGVYTAIQNAGGGSGGFSITVDDALSATSENPVQNKVIYQALQNSGGGSGSVGWRELTSSEFGIVAYSNVSSINNVSAIYCAALGLVMFFVELSPTSQSSGSVTSPNGLIVKIDEGKYYSPNVGCASVYLTSSDNKVLIANAAITNQRYIRVTFNGSVSSASSACRISGIYYTEDLPT